MGVISRLFQRSATYMSRWLIGLLSPDAARCLAEIALQHAHTFGPSFLTLDTNAKTDGPLRYGLVDPVTAEPQGRIAVVVQGPLVTADDFTFETVRYYQRSCPEFMLIVSTWEGENPCMVARLRDLGVQVLLSPKPAVAGRYNVNFQSTSSAAGIAHAIAAGCRFVAKTRADQRLCAIHTLYGLPALLDAFPPAAGIGQRARLISTSYGTYKNNPFHFSDFFQFGDAKDMLRYWAPEHDICNLTRAELESYRTSSIKFLDYYAYSPEKYLITQFISSFGENLPLTVEAWWKVLAERLLVLDWQQLDVYWPKYAANVARADLHLNRVVVTNQVSFADSVRLVLSSAAERQPPERVLDLPAMTETSLRLMDLPWKLDP